MLWEIALKAIVPLVSLVAAYLQVRSFVQSSHSTLKTDLEILNLLRRSDAKEQSANYKVVEEYVDDSIARIYKKRRTPENSKLYRDRDFVKGLLILVSFFAITGFLLFKEGLTLLSLLPALVALTGLGQVMGALQRRSAHGETNALADLRDLSNRDGSGELDAKSEIEKVKAKECSAPATEQSKSERDT